MRVDFDGTKDQMAGGSSMDVSINVKNPNTSAPISSADVVMTVKSGPANLSLRNGYQGNVSNDKLSISGKADANGRFMVQLNTGNVSANGSVILAVSATKKGYDDASAEFGIKIRADIPRSISIVKFDIDPSTLYPGERASVRVQVVGKDSAPLKGASVSFSVDPPNTIDPPVATTGADGIATSTLSVPPGIPENITSFDVRAEAKANFSGIELNDSQSKSVSIVRQPSGWPYSPDQTRVIVLAMFAAVAVVFLLIVMLMPRLLRQRHVKKKISKSVKKK
jgi:hypothetical protein